MRFKIRKAVINQNLREHFDLFGEQVIALALSHPLPVSGN
jgi:hypothetical protein